jgi:hypothetical protein
MRVGRVPPASRPRSLGARLGVPPPTRAQPVARKRSKSLPTSAMPQLPTAVFPSGQRRSPWCRRGAVLVFLITSILMTAVGRGERSGWILMTSPAGEDRGNSLLGYSFLHGGRPFMKENIPAVAQVGVFSGSLDALRRSEYRDDFRFLRALYGMLGSLLAPFFGVIGGLLAINWVCWALCALAAWRITWELSADELAAMFAVFLVSWGIGMIAHIGDYSPHLLAFAGYYLGVWFLLRAGAYSAPRPLRTHLALATFMGIVCLAYNTGVMLIAVYFLTSLRHNRWRHVAFAAVLGLSARPLWHLLCIPRVVDAEGLYLGRAMAAWEGLANQGLGSAIASILGWISEFVFFFDSPLVVLGGLAVCFWPPLSRSQRLFGCSAVAVPLLAALVFAPVAGARGYLVYGVSAWLYPLLALHLARGFRSGRPAARIAAELAAGVLLASHLGWSTAHLWHQLGPLKAYSFGWDDGVPYLVSPATRALSLTGHEPSPVLFGGRAYLAAAGAHVAPDRRSVEAGEVSLPVACMTRGWFFVWFGLLAWLALPALRQRLACLGGLAACLLLSSCLSWLTFREAPCFFHVDRAITVPPGGSLTCRVALSQQFLDAIPHDAEGPRTLTFFCKPAESDLTFRFYCGPAPLATRPTGGRFINEVPAEDYTRTLQALRQTRQITLVVTNPTGNVLWVSGWQRNRLLDRQCTVAGVEQAGPVATEVLPILEVRFLRPNGRIDLVGF